MTSLANIANLRATKFTTDICSGRGFRKKMRLEQLVTELKTLMKDCEYLAEIQDEQIRDHIVFAVRPSKIRQKMILEGLTFARRR